MLEERKAIFTDDLNLRDSLVGLEPADTHDGPDEDMLTDLGGPPLTSHL